MTPPESPPLQSPSLCTLHATSGCLKQQEASGPPARSRELMNVLKLLSRGARLPHRARVRLALAAGAALLVCAAPAQAQTLREAVETAWQRQPAAQAQIFRSAELAARAKAANAWVPSPPSIGLSERSDRFNRNAGAREVEAELSVPLWLPGQRQRESALAAAEQDLQRDALEGAKWKLAGEVREAFWQARSAEADRLAAVRRLTDATALTTDVERRLKAGDLARTDFNQAKGAEHTARAVVNEAEVRTARALLSFTTLTGLETLPAADEAPAANAPPLTAHPALRQLDRIALAADARVRLATDIRRDNPELTLGYRHERSSKAEAYGGAIMVGIRIPLATDARNEPKIAAANADFIEARTAHALLRGQLQAEVLASQRELQQARAGLVLVEERQRLAAENDQLLGKAFSLGEIDLATRLRTAAERHAADADSARSRVEAGRAVSRLNQAFGVLP